MILLFNQLNLVANSIIVLIILILLTSIIMSFRLRSKYNNMLKDIHDPQHRESASFYNDVLNKITKEYKSVIQAKKEGINTFALVDKFYHSELKWFELGEKFISKAISLTIVLGLLGTFYGLTLSIGELVQLLSTTGSEIVNDVGSITVGLISSVEGMSVAFITSLFGIGASVILTILNIMFNLNNLRDSVLISIEEYLDNNLNIRNEPNMFQTSFEILAKSMENNFIVLADVIKNQLSDSMEGLLTVSESFKYSIEKFDGSLNKFDENIRDFSEFNHHLKTNIQRMAVSFEDLTTNLKESNGQLKEITNDIMNNKQ